MDIWAPPLLQIPQPVILLNSSRSTCLLYMPSSVIDACTGVLPSSSSSSSSFLSCGSDFLTLSSFFSRPRCCWHHDRQIIKGCYRARSLSFAAQTVGGAVESFSAGVASWCKSETLPAGGKQQQKRSKMEKRTSAPTISSLVFFGVRGRNHCMSVRPGQMQGKSWLSLQSFKPLPKKVGNSFQESCDSPTPWQERPIQGVTLGKKFAEFQWSLWFPPKTAAPTTGNWRLATAGQVS